MELHDWVGAVLATGASVVVAWLTARGAKTATEIKGKVDTELGNAQLALAVAQEVRAELAETRAELGRVKAEQKECHQLLDALQDAWRRQLGTDPPGGAINA